MPRQPPLIVPLAPSRDAAVFVDWPLGPDRPQLSADEIHVWWAKLPAQAAPQDWAVLQSDERQRAQNARSKVFQNHFVASRGVLRILLGRYLGCPPQAVQLASSPHQKPYLAPSHCSGLEFNISHTGQELLLAFAWQRSVGVDIERAERLCNWEEFARVAFSEQEIRALRALPEAARAAAALAVWVRKEAYSKARGTGLGHGFPRFTVSAELTPEGPVLLQDTSDPTAVEHWWITHLPVSAEWGAALAGQREPGPAPRPRLQCWRWPDGWP